MVRLSDLVTITLPTSRIWTDCPIRAHLRSHEIMATKAALLREDWTTAEQIDRVQLQLLDVVDFINRFHASVKTRLAVLNEKMTAIERKLRYVENAVRKASSSTERPAVRCD